MNESYNHANCAEPSPYPSPGVPGEGRMGENEGRTREERRKNAGRNLVGIFVQSIRMN
jgi:hypothetical protein